MLEFVLSFTPFQTVDPRLHHVFKELIGLLSKTEFGNLDLLCGMNVAQTKRVRPAQFAAATDFGQCLAAVLVRAHSERFALSMYLLTGLTPP